MVARRQRLIHQVTDHPRQRDHESVEHALNQRQRHHVAVGDVADLVTQHRFRLLGGHLFQQAGADRDQRRVAVGAGGEGVGFRRIVNSDFRHADAGLLRLAAHGFHQPLFGLGAWLLDDLGTDRHLGDPLRHQQRDQGAAHTEDGGKDQQAGQVEPGLIKKSIHTQQSGNHAQQQHDTEVGGNEQHDTLHGVFS